MEPSAERIIHELQIRRWDARKGLAVGLLRQAEAPLSFARGLIQRGQFGEARRVLGLLAASQYSSPSPERAQIAFEETRLAFFESDWLGVIELAGRALGCGAPPVTQLAILQLRANANFELARFGEACADIDQAETLGSLYPHATSLYYVQTLRIRIIARDRGPGRAAALLDQLLERKLKEGRSDLDLLLTYFRVRIDILRLQGAAYRNEALASHLLADAIGDGLYAGLGALDFYSSQAPSVAALSGRMSQWSDSFARIRRLLQEVSGEREASVSAITIRSAIRGGRPSLPEAPGELPESIDAPHHGEVAPSRHLVVVPRLTLVVDPSPFRLSRFPSAAEQGYRVLLALGGEPRQTLSKEKLFARVWGSQKYAPRLHDTLISSLLHRIRRDHGVSICSRQGLIACEKTLLVTGD